MRSRESGRKSNQMQKYLQGVPVDEKVVAGIPLNVDDLLTKEGLILIESWRRDGATLSEIAARVGMSAQGLSRIRKRYPEIEDALIKGKEVVDYMVESALLKCALGYKQTTVKTFIQKSPNKRGNRTVRIEKTETEVGPSHVACLAWLNSRKPESWKHNRDNMLEYEDRKNGITINIIKGEEQDEDSKGNRTVERENDSRNNG